MLVSTFASKNLYSKNNEINKTSTIGENSALNCLDLGNFHNNNLIDFNYGRTLIKNKNISFGSIASADLTKKVSIALNELEYGDFLLIGRDFETAKKLLMDSLRDIKHVINKILFIEDKKFAEYAAIKSTGNKHYDVLNLDDDIIKIKIRNEEFSLTQKAKTLPITNGMELSINDSSLKISTGIEESGDSLESLGIHVFDLSNVCYADIRGLNLERLNKIKSSSKVITFEDVGGHAKAKKILKEQVIYPLKFPAAYGKARTFGIVVAGIPGTGKSFLIRALFNEIRKSLPNVNLKKINGPDIKKQWVGAPTETMRDILKDARKDQPCIVYIKEVDSIAQDRGSHDGRTHLNVVDQILTEMDNIKDNNEQIVLIMDTNRPDILDKALIRAERAGTYIFLEPPKSVEECREVLKIQNKDILNDLIISETFDETGFSEKLFSKNVGQADIADIVKRVRRLALESAQIPEKMENDTFRIKDLANVIVKPEDFDNALDCFVKERSAFKNYENNNLTQS